jgi:hypothetical protein
LATGVFKTSFGGLRCLKTSQTAEHRWVRRMWKRIGNLCTLTEVDVNMKFFFRHDEGARAWVCICLTMDMAWICDGQFIEVIGSRRRSRSRRSRLDRVKPQKGQAMTRAVGGLAVTVHQCTISPQPSRLDGRSCRDEINGRCKNISTARMQGFR